MSGASDRRTSDEKSATSGISPVSGNFVRLEARTVNRVVRADVDVIRIVSEVFASRLPEYT